MIRKTRGLLREMALWRFCNLSFRNLDTANHFICKESWKIFVAHRKTSTINSNYRLAIFACICIIISGRRFKINKMKINMKIMLKTNMKITMKIIMKTMLKIITTTMMKTIMKIVMKLCRKL